MCQSKAVLYTEVQREQVLLFTLALFPTHSRSHTTSHTRTLSLSLSNSSALLARGGTTVVRRLRLAIAAHHLDPGGGRMAANQANCRMSPSAFPSCNLQKSIALLRSRPLGMQGLWQGQLLIPHSRVSWWATADTLQDSTLDVHH